MTNTPTMTQGRVLACLGERLKVQTAAGSTTHIYGRRKLGIAVPGDRVHWQLDDNGCAQLTQILPRDNLLKRPDRYNKLRPVSANISQILIIAAHQPAFERQLIDQYCVIAHDLGAQIGLIFNKEDAWSAQQRTELEQCAAQYADIGLNTLFLSSLSGSGLTALKALLHDHETLFVGQSGVGKSSLARRLLPEQEIGVGALSAKGQGAHTTSTARLYALDSGGWLVDTPGVREFRVAHIDPEIIHAAFTEIHTAAAQCKFHNCKHRREPGCAVHQAIDKQQIDPRRLQHLHSFLDEHQALAQYAR